MDCGVAYEPQKPAVHHDHPEGGLLPPDLLARIAATDAELGGLTPADYGLERGERLSEAAAQACAACKTYPTGRPPRQR